MGDVVLREQTVGLEAKKSSWGAKKNGDAKVLDSIVSAQSRNLRNLETVVHSQNPETVCQSQDCAIHLCNLVTARVQFVNVAD